MRDPVVTAPPDADPTSAAYLAKTPLSYFGGGGLHVFAPTLGALGVDRTRLAGVVALGCGSGSMDRTA